MVVTAQLALWSSTSGRRHSVHSLHRLKGKSLHNLRLLASVAIGVLLLAASAGSAKEPVKYHHGVIIRFRGRDRSRAEKRIFTASWMPPSNRAPTW